MRSSVALRRVARLAVALVAAVGAAQAQTSFDDRLSGDWGGVRSTLAGRGVIFDLESASYYQGLLSGSGDDDFEYGGRLDAFLDFDTGKLGLWNGGAVRTHAEYRYGDLSANLGGALLATNAAFVLPTGKHEEVVVTSIHLAQRFGERISVLLGRINMLDLIAADPFFAGGGRSRFLNVAFSAPPSGITPPVIMGAVITLRTTPIAWTFMVFDPDDRTNDYWPDDFFDNGVDVSVSASYAGEMLGRMSSVTVTGTYTTKDSANLGELLLPPDLQTGQRDHSWYIGVQLSHYLHESPGREGCSWGVFLKTNASDGNPNPFQASIMGGVGGRGLLASRPNDTFGLGYFYVDFSDELTSAYQIEGAWNEDGKGPSIWDTYAHTPGNIANGDTGDVANDHYHRYKEDVALMKDIGATAYRFSISWPRIFPEGTGQPNPKGLDFYSRLVDELKSAGIEPFVTLYHWDPPQALHDKGGWQSRDTAQAFADYAGYVAEKLSDRIRHFFTINEFRSFTEAGYKGFEIPAPGGTRTVFLAPGLKLPAQEFHQVCHHTVLAHGLAVQAIRAKGRQGTKVGPAENIEVAVPLIERTEHIKAAEAATRELNAPYLTVMLEGRYTDEYLKQTGKDAPKFTDEDLKIIASPLDFVGINVYTAKTFVLASDQAPGWREAGFSKGHAKAAISNVPLGPTSIYWAPKFVQSLWKAKEIYITENGCAGEDVLADDGQVYDTERITFLQAYLTQLQRATADGVPVKGYFHWSMMDNFEWVRGYGNRYGMVYVDFKTQKRTPKMSALWFREAAKRNAVV